MRIWWLALLAAWLAIGPANAAPLEAYGRMPMLEDVQISPDGQRMALVVTDGEQRTIAVRTIGVATPTHLLNAGDAKLRSLQWAGSNHLLLSISSTRSIADVIADRSEYAVTQIFDLQARRSTPLFRAVRGTTLNVTALGPYVVEDSGRTVVVAGGIQFVDNMGRLSLFRTALGASTTSIETTGAHNTIDYVIDAQGRAIARLQADRDTGAWVIQLRGAGTLWQNLQPGPEYGSAPSLLGLGRAGRSIAVGGDEGEGYQIRELSLETAAWSLPLGRPGLSTPLFDPQTLRLVGVSTLDGNAETRTYFDPADQARWNALRAAYPGQRIVSVSYSADRRRAIALVDSPTEGPAYAYVDFATGRATWIGPQYRGIAEADIGPVRYITYRAADGTAISGYLTLPRGREGRNLPLVVLPHGGPEARDVPGFDWWAQALASRGYAVLQPNFRGSSGYGAAFIEAGLGQWGRRVQTDLSDGVAHLAREGVIDASRVCIVGASYGGYAALAGVTVQRGVYRCAASYGGVADPRGLINYRRGSRGNLTRRYWSEFMGVTGANDPRLAEISPLSQAATADAPILLIHGRDDIVVPISQSQQMAAALRRANRPVQLVELRGEDHWLSRGETRLQMLTEVVRFLEQHNPPTAPAAP